MPEEVAMDVALPALDSTRAVLPNNILVLSDDTPTPASVILLKRAAASLLTACRAQASPAQPTPPQALICGPQHSCTLAEVC